MHTRSVRSKLKKRLFLADKVGIMKPSHSAALLLENMKMTSERALEIQNEQNPTSVLNNNFVASGV